MDSSAFFDLATRSPDSKTISFARLSAVANLPVLQNELSVLLRREWVDHVNRQDYQGGWDVLPLRCQRQHLKAHPVLQGFSIATGDDWQNLDILESCPAISMLLSKLECPLKAVRLMRLKAGAMIKPHRDQGLSIEHGEARLHLPLQTSNNVIFSVNQQAVPMQAGELWYINADQEHAVHNRGSEDRINLVIDCVANDWLREKIDQGNHCPEPRL